MGLGSSAISIAVPSCGIYLRSLRRAHSVLKLSAGHQIIVNGVYLRVFRLHQSGLGIGHFQVQADLTPVAQFGELPGRDRRLQGGIGGGNLLGRRRQVEISLTDIQRDIGLRGGQGGRGILGPQPRFLDPVRSPPSYSGTVSVADTCAVRWRGNWNEGVG